ncbi:MAG: DUF1295 domain-containing protein [Ilumatobacteraceae bacterium]
MISSQTNDIGLVMTTAAIVIAALMLTTWLVSVALKNASIVDVVWGLGFVCVAWAVRLQVDTDSKRPNLLVAMTTIWGLRLAFHLFWRNHVAAATNKGEDYRYRAMRKRWGVRFPLISLVTVFLVQGVLMFVVSLPIQLGQVSDNPTLGALVWYGGAVYLIGLFFEVVGDAQLTRFRKDPANAGTVMNKGLWRYTRHPNYFGDACVWWGIALVAAATGYGRWGLIGALVMTVLLRRVSGVTLLEKSLSKRRAGYDEYVARTNAFVPWRPKRT